MTTERLTIRMEPLQCEAQFDGGIRIRFHNHADDNDDGNDDDDDGKLWSSFDGPRFLGVICQCEIRGTKP